MRKYFQLLLMAGGLLIAGAAFAVGKALSYLDLTAKTKDITVFSKSKNKLVKIREAEDRPKKFLMVHQTDGSQNPPADNWLKVKSHLGVPGKGKLILIHPIFADVVGSYANTTSLEIAGKFPANVKSGQYADDSAEFDHTHQDKLTPDQKAGIEAGIDLFLAENLKRGVLPRQLQLIAHENTYASRIFDPGQEPWQYAARYARRRGMIVDENYKDDSGTPIHPEWRVT